jgi:hypothetical protein
MKPRKVVVTLEIESDLDLRSIKTFYEGPINVFGTGTLVINQVQVNVIKAEKK